MIHEGVLVDRKRIRTLDQLETKLFEELRSRPGTRLALFGYTYRTARLIVDFQRMVGPAFQPVCVIDNHKAGEPGVSKSIPILSLAEAERIAGEIDLIVVMIDSASLYAVLAQITESAFSNKRLLCIHRNADPLTESEFLSLCTKTQEVLARQAVIWNTDEKNWYCCYQYLKQVATLQGDVAEFGVFQGGSAYFLAAVMDHLGMGRDRRLHLFDTFEGIATQAPVDFVETSTFQSGEYDRVARLMAPFPYVRLVRGDVRDTLESSLPERLVLAHVDCDQYEPTLRVCEAIYPRMTPGGIVMFQNYSFGAACGERVAVDLFFRNRPEAVMFGYDGAAFVMKL